MIMRKISAKSIASIFIFVFVISLVGCIPERYTEEEEAMLNEKGKEAVSAWFEANEPTATFSDPSVHYDNNEYGLSDAFYGEYTLKGDTHYYFYVISEDKMYSDKYMDIASETCAAFYADGLGIKNYESEFKNELVLPINYEAWYDRSGKGEMRTAEVSDVFGYLPYELEEKDIGDYLKKEFDFSDTYNRTWIKYVSDVDHIDKGDINIDFLKAHPYIHRFDIRCKNSDDYYYVAITNKEVDGKSKKVLQIVSYKKGDDGIFAKDREWIYDI